MNKVSIDELFKQLINDYWTIATKQHENELLATLASISVIENNAFRKPNIGIVFTGIC